ncbi:MAG: hypothetical protein IID33_18175 [Planctomycetes bacterium]|nr:hypothetical protein [Planctomycetota bacterium]
MVKMPESVILDIIRTVQLSTPRENVQKVTVTTSIEVAFQILNTKRTVLNQTEAETGATVVIRGDAAFTSDQVEYACEDSYGRPVVVASATPPTKSAR